jgi:predicted ATPase
MPADSRTGRECTSPGALMIVEQPESQLHPTAQLALGYFLC